MGSGSYIHYGLEDGLTDFLLKNELSGEKEIIVDFNIDGLPMAKSSNSQVWPILYNVVDTSYVFLVGLYSGNSKPKNSNAYMLTFIEELKCLISDGIDYKCQNYPVKVRAFICDAPARSFILNVKGHTGYYSCLRCMQKGHKIGHRMTFPSFDAECRTNENFRKRVQPEFHSNLAPIALELLNIDCVHDVILDYMHVVCLGVVRTMLNLWIMEKGENFSFTKRKIQELSLQMENIKKQVPSEFCRTPRGLAELKKWKATEYRQFLLYTALFILKGILDDERYEHFLKLCVAIRILLDKNDCISNNGCAEKLLKSFVKSMTELYGSQYITHNFHCLIHISSDAKNHGVQAVHNFISLHLIENYFLLYM